MNTFQFSKKRAVTCSVSALVLLTLAFSTFSARAEGPAEAQVTVVASQLNDPRGLEFGPDKHLYVAEAGTGGVLSTIGQCDQVAFPVGPQTGGFTASIRRIEDDGTTTLIADHLPSSSANPAIGGDRMGVADVAFVGDHLLSVIAGAGCSHGHAAEKNGVYKVDPSDVSLLADLSTWLLANPGAKGAEHPRNPDYEPDGTWYSLIWDQGRLYTVEPNHGLLVSVQHDSGRIELVNDLFATFGDHTYTTLAIDRGDLYIGTLGQIAFGPGGPDLANSFQAGIYRLSRDGSATQVASGLHAVQGLAFDSKHRLYVLQSPIFVPGTGSLVRLDPGGNIEPVLTGLTFPAGLTTGPDDALYLSECGYHCSPGDGRVLRVTIP